MEITRAAGRHLVLFFLRVLFIQNEDLAVKSALCAHFLQHAPSRCRSVYTKPLLSLQVLARLQGPLK